MDFRCLLMFCFLAGSPLFGQEKAAGVSRNEEAMSSFQAVNASIHTILQEYEQLTGNAVIGDSSLAGNTVPITISVPKPVPRSELVRIIESALLLNNYALISRPRAEERRSDQHERREKSPERGSSSLRKSGLAFSKMRPAKINSVF